MNSLWEFLSLSNPNVRWVVAGSVLIGSGASIVGCFSFLRKQSLIGDAVAHSILPGVALGFIFSGTKDPLFLLIGALISGWISIVAIDFISNKSRIKPDTAIAIVLSVFFAVGMVLLSYIQNTSTGNHAGLNSFLFGKAASMLIGDVLVFSIVDLILIIAVFLFFPYLKALSFDKDFARASGLPVKFLEFLLATLTVLAVATGIQAVGVVLMAAIIITPAATARFWTSNLVKMILYAMGIGAFSAVFGSYISFIAPAMPTGPWIVMFLSLIAICTFFFAPKKGILARQNIRKRHRRKMLHENILKALFHLNESHQGQRSYSYSELMDLRAFDARELQKSIKVLTRRGLLSSEGNKIALTRGGLDESSRIVRLHRLWELYLSEKMNIAEDHVHHDAEAIEHILTPELEKQLLSELNYPLSDPHASAIPGIKKPADE